MLCSKRFSQGLRMRQIDLMEDGVAASSKTLSKMASVMRRVRSKSYYNCSILHVRRLYYTSTNGQNFHDPQRH